MKKITTTTRMAAVALLTGAMMFQLGSCTTQDVKTQLSRGFSTALNGMFSIVASDLANEVFDVDD